MPGQAESQIYARWICSPGKAWLLDPPLRFHWFLSKWVRVQRQEKSAENLQVYICSGDRTATKHLIKSETVNSIRHFFFFYSAISLLRCLKSTHTRMLSMCVYTYRHGDMPAVPYADIHGQVHTFSFNLGRWIKMYLFLFDRTACTLEKGILVQFRCNTGIILIAGIWTLHCKYSSVSFYNHISTIHWLYSLTKLSVNVGLKYELYWKICLHTVKYFSLRGSVHIQDSQEVVYRTTSPN